MHDRHRLTCTRRIGIHRRQPGFDDRDLRCRTRTCTSHIRPPPRRQRDPAGVERRGRVEDLGDNGRERSVWGGKGVARELRERARRGSIANVVEDRAHGAVGDSAAAEAYGCVVVGHVEADLVGQAAEVVAIGVHVPEGPGGVRAYLGPETLHVTAAVGVVGWATYRDFRVPDYSSLVFNMSLWQ